MGKFSENALKLRQCVDLFYYLAYFLAALVEGFFFSSQAAEVAKNRKAKGHKKVICIRIIDL